MLAILMLTLSQTPPAWGFQDELARDGRTMATFRTVELGDTAPRRALSDDEPLAGARFGDLPLGPGGAARRAVVWHADSGTLWLDADGDGRFAKSERHTLLKGTLETRVSFPIGDTPVTRTVLIKRRDGGLAYAVRGYASGSLTLKAGTYPALLTDGNADGCFDSAAADRVWVDLDKDRKFDALTEQFPLGTPLTHGGTAYLLRPDPAASRVTVRERPAEAGTVRLTVSRLPGSDVAGLTAHLVSEWGELVTVPRTDSSHSLPAGQYRIDSAELRLKGPDGHEWTYSFVGPREFVLSVTKGKETAFDLTAGVRVTVDLGAGRDKGSVRVRPDIVTVAGLYLRDCSAVGLGGSRLPPVQATIRLAGPGSSPADEVHSGFL
jgi:hypothetical protein